MAKGGRHRFTLSGFALCRADLTQDESREEVGCCTGAQHISCSALHVSSFPAVLCPLLLPLVVSFDHYYFAF